MQDDEIIQLNPKTRELERISLVTGEVLTTSSNVPERWVYSLELSAKICEYIRLGHTLSEISDIEGMPSQSLVAAWKHRHPDFKEKLNAAYKDRGEFYHDRVLHLVRNGDIGKDDVPGVKLAVDAYKWAAERADPERYGGKVKAEEGVGPTVIMIDTGFRRPEPVVEDAEFSEVTDPPPAPVEAHGNDERLSVDNQTTVE